MNSSTNPSAGSPKWVTEIAELIQHMTGVQLGERQTAMLENRLQKRMRDLGLASPEGYLDYVKNHVDVEAAHLVSLLTTHHTYFFREFPAFEFLHKEALPKIIPHLKQVGRKSLRVWSAACSQGQEVYSLSMFLYHHMKALAPDMSYEILGTDVDPESVNKAKNGVYRWNDVKEIPLIYLWNHWVRGSGDIKDFVKAKPTLKQTCKFEAQNLMNTPDPKPGQTYDIIFCRNVFIYFTPAQVKAICTQLLKHLSPQGYLIIGSSESLLTLNLPVQALGPAIYTHKGAQPAKTATQTSTAKAHLTVVSGGAKPATPASLSVSEKPETKKKIRVLCVDDSLSVLTLLKKVLSDEFEVVATAKNGFEAAEALKKNQVDVMTLDIHMPGQSGLEYLKANMNSQHPPVVMISSVPREDSHTAFECLQLGASDYVEKPSLNELSTRTDEIRTKVRCAAVLGRQGEVSSPEIDRSFHQKFTIQNPDQKFRVVIAGIRDRNKLAVFCSELPSPQPPTVIFVEGAQGALPAMKEMLHSKAKVKVELLDAAGGKLNPETVYIADFTHLYDEVKRQHASKPTSLIVLGDLSKESLLKIKSWPAAHVIMEDLEVEMSANHKELMRVAKYVVPYTSMAYHSNEFLSKADGNKTK